MQSALSEPIEFPVKYDVELTNPDILPFRQWSDVELNNERWDKLVEVKERNRSICNTINSPVDKLLYEDDQAIHLPFNITAYEWKRPSELFPHKEISVTVDCSNYPDLIRGSQHLLHSEFVRNFISSVHILMYLSNTDQFKTEAMSTPLFVPNIGPWKPWHNVYGKCKAGKDIRHAPLFNSFGKYVVRLFWMGSWRHINVDDRIPLDRSGNIILPSMNLIHEDNEEDNVLELWPFLLFKALLKVGSLTRYEDREIVEFDILQCLSGWTPQVLNIKGLTSDEIWSICSANIKHFVWEDIKKERQLSVSKPTSSISNTCFLVKCKNLRKIPEEDFPNISPCWSHYFLIDEIRDIPTEKPPEKLDVPLWKTFRWVKWAQEKGIIPPESDTSPIRCAKLISSFRECDKHVTYRQRTESELTFLKHNAKFQETAPEKEVKVKSKMSQSYSISDLSIWLDFSIISGIIDSVLIFHKPSLFPINIKITDLDENYSNAIVVKSSIQLRESRNEPIYGFIDSIDYKLLIFNLSQTGNLNVLDESINYSVSSFSEGSETSCETTILFRRVRDRFIQQQYAEKYETIKGLPRIVKSDDIIVPVVLVKPKYEDVAYMVVEEYFWEKPEPGPVITTLSTIGSKTVLVELKPGRHIFKIWIKSPNPFMLDIISDTPMKIGGLENILHAMSEESQLLQNICSNISYSFAELVYSFGSSEYRDKLKSFYKSYKPKSLISKSESIKLHDFFYKFFYNLVEATFSQADVLKAARILLLKFNIPTKLSTFYPDPCFDVDKVVDEELFYVKFMERTSTIIQGFFKGCYERLLLKYHESTHKHHVKVSEQLKTIYLNIMAVSVYISNCSMLMRQIINQPELSAIQEKFDFYQDLPKVVREYSITHNFQVTTGWNLLCRYIFYINTLDDLLLKINLFCNLPKYSVRVFNNETGEEILRFTNNVEVYKYKNIAKGYTILCYGWSKQNFQIPWKLNFTLRKGVVEVPLLIEEFCIKIDTITDYYTPNSRNLLLQYIISIKSATVLLTFRLTCSYKDAKCKVRLLNDKKEIIYEIKGGNNIIVPAIFIESAGKKQVEVPTSLERKMSLARKRVTKRPKDGSYKGSTLSIDKTSIKSARKTATVHSLKKETTEILQNEEQYVLEVYIEKDSWPLSAVEWNTVHKIKRNKLYGTSSKSVQKISGTLRKTKYLSITKIADDIDEPYWILSIISNYEDVFQINPDLNNINQFRAFKRSWQANDPERYITSREIRNLYLEENSTVSIIPTSFANQSESNLSQSIDTEVRTLTPIKLTENWDTFDISRYYLRQPNDDNKKIKRLDNFIKDDEQLEIDITNYDKHIEEENAKLKVYEESQTQHWDAMRDAYKSILRDNSRESVNTIRNKWKSMAQKLKDEAKKEEKSINRTSTGKRKQK